MKLSYAIDKGIAPKIADHLLPVNKAVIAENCNLGSGEIRPVFNDDFVQALVSGPTVYTIFLFEGAYWYEFTGHVDIQPSPVVNDYLKRTYWTGSGILKKTDSFESINVGTGA